MLVPLDTAKSASAIATVYSRVFDRDCASQAVYQQAGRGLVHSSMEGYNSTIFAYGPTGSGKTFTMQSVMQLSARDIFDFIQQHHSREFLVRVSAMEIYNEAVRDLLGGHGGMPLKVLEDPERGTCAEGLAEEGVESVEHLEQLLQRVAERRQVRRVALAAAPVALRRRRRPAAQAGACGGRAGRCGGGWPGAGRARVMQAPAAADAGHGEQRRQQQVARDRAGVHREQASAQEAG
jgi:centromeric protein E